MEELRLTWCVDGATSWQQTHLNPQRNSTMAKAKTKRTRHQAKIHPIRVTEYRIRNIFTNLPFNKDDIHFEEITPSIETSENKPRVLPDLPRPKLSMVRAKKMTQLYHSPSISCMHANTSCMPTRLLSRID